MGEKGGVCGYRSGSWCFYFQNQLFPGQSGENKNQQISNNTRYNHNNCNFLNKIYKQHKMISSFSSSSFQKKGHLSIVVTKESMPKIKKKKYKTSSK